MSASTLPDLLSAVLPPFLPEALSALLGHDRTPLFGSYVTPAMAPPPASVNVLARVYEKLGTTDPTVLFPLDGNDHYRDCTIAAAAHANTVFRGLAGARYVMSQQEVLGVFNDLTGGANQGLHSLDVLKYWKQKGIGDERILAYLRIDPKNHEHVQLAIQHFGGVYLAFKETAQCQKGLDPKHAWTTGPLTSAGHAVFAVAYDAAEVSVLTWGNVQQGTWDWWDECVYDAFAIVPPEAADAGFAPGFDFARLKADLAAGRE